MAERRHDNFNENRLDSDETQKLAEVISRTLLNAEKTGTINQQLGKSNVSHMGSAREPIEFCRYGFPLGNRFCRLDNFYEVYI